MAELDAEILERAVGWCAAAGRTVTPAEVARALGRLSWDDLLAAKALLAEPPPARPLGPHALADIARGAPPDVAAEREREGRYRDEREVGGSSLAASPPPRRRKGSPAPRRAAPVIRRARDRAPAPGSPGPSARPDLEELRRPEGRTVLERLVRRLGARRRALATEIAAGWSKADGGPPGEADLAALLAHHGLLRSFEHRERDELLHAIRAAGGVRVAAAERLGLDVPGLEAALGRLGAAREAERIREERREELRGRGTLAERVRLLLADAPRLADLGLLEEFERDVAGRLPEHVRALRAGTEPLPAALRRSLALTRSALEALQGRFGLDLARRGPPPERRSPSRRPPPPGGPRRASPSKGATSPRRDPRGRGRPRRG